MAKTLKYYAVKIGRNPGIYPTWEECSAQVTGFAGAVYKSFATLQDARNYLKGKGPETATQMALLELAPPGPSAEPPRAAVPGAGALAQATLYSDGGALRNPGPGGFGVVLIQDGKRREFSGGFRRTTNNRMELLAVITGLEALDEPSSVKIYSDSSYIVNAMQKGWARRWQAGRWQRKDGPVPNADLWERLLAAANGHHLEFEWVPGHAGIPENERCDRLAVEASRRPNLPPDAGYEREEARQ